MNLAHPLRPLFTGGGLYWRQRQAVPHARIPDPESLALVLLTVVNGALSRPGVWGFAGAIIYGTTKLLTDLKEAADAKGRSNAYVQWAIALFAGSVAAEAFGPSLVKWKFIGSALDIRALSFTIGIAGNRAWPAVNDLIIGRLKKWGS